jgi:hypothetical protein
MHLVGWLCALALLVAAPSVWAGDRTGNRGSDPILAQYSQVAGQVDAKQLVGTYDLYNLLRTKLVGELPKASNRMVISAGDGDTFRVGSPSDIVKPENVWRGTGKLQGRRGYYDWKFDDGKTGRTDFVVTADNNLIGFVQIADPDKQATFNWWYLAKRRR